MKKLLFMLLGIAATINVMAVDYTAKAKLTLSATSGYESILRLQQSDDFGELDGAEMYMDVIGLYAIKGTTPLTTAQAADFTNVQLGLKADASTSYTITVSNVSGNETLVLFDLETQEQYNLTEGNIINFSITGDERNSTIEDRFVINYQAPASAYNVKLNAYGYATFSADKEVSVPAGLTVWTGSSLGAEELSCEPLDGNIPANTGVLLWGDANAEFSLPIIANGNEPAVDNLFIPASEWANFGGQGLVLSGNMLYKYEGADFKANKAFLELSAGNPAPRRIRLVVDQATGVENVEATVKAEKFIENGQVLIKRGENIYNLQGQIVK